MLPHAATPCSEDADICERVFDWTGSSVTAEVADVIIGKPLAVTGLLLLGLVIRWVLHRVVDRVVRGASTGSTARLGRSARHAQRARTMGSLLKSIITTIVIAVIATMILSEIGVNIAPIIASAGIIGIALGFGAQSLVSDYLAGMFMIVEDQYGVGDEIDLGEAIGTVEAVTLRVTRLRDINGTVWYVRNGEILRVGNMSQNWSRTVLDVRVSYEEDLVKVRRVLQDVAHDLWDDDDFKGRVIDEPEVWGVQDLGHDSVLVRIALKTAPAEQWAVAREMRQRIKARFDHEGIQMPVPLRMAWQQAPDADRVDGAGDEGARETDPAERPGE